MFTSDVGRSRNYYLGVSSQKTARLLFTGAEGYTAVCSTTGYRYIIAGSLGRVIRYQISVPLPAITGLSLCMEVPRTGAHDQSKTGEQVPTASAQTVGDEERT